MDSMWVYLFVFLILGVCGSHVNEMQMETNFSWKNCNTTAAPLAFRGLSVSPNPIQYGELVHLTFDLIVTQDIGTTHTLKADVECFMIYEKESYNMCNYGPQYCHIEDVCKEMDPLKNFCPESVKKLGTDCQCPLKKNEYKVKDMAIPIRKPSLMVEGTFNLTIHLTEAKKEVGCLGVMLCLGSCS